MNDFRSYSELYHYGVVGMHWGVRRYQPYPSDYKGKGVERIQTKYLNAHSRMSVVNTRAMEIAKKKMKRYDKNSIEYKKFKQHYKDAEASKKYAQKEINKILSKLDKKKVDVTKKSAYGWFDTPGELLAYYTALSVGGIIPAVGVAAYNDFKNEGSLREYTKYKVRKKKSKKKK